MSSLKVFDMLTALTGATGFLGSYLLRELLATGGEVVALVRGSLATAARRVRHAVEATGSPLPEDFDQRVHLLRYDLHDHALGLDRAAYTALAESIDAVWHCAGSIALTGPWDQLYRTNVDGTRHVLELARAAGPTTRVMHTSTAYVAGARLHGLVREDELDDTAGFQTPYEKSKFLAEQVVHDWARRHQHPVTILRPSVLVTDRPVPPGAPRHPLAEIAAKMSLLHQEENIRALIELTGRDTLHLRIQGDPEALHNVVQVEHAAAAMVRISGRAPDRLVNTCHIVHPRNTPVRMITDAMHVCCSRLKVDIVREAVTEGEAERAAIDVGAGISSYATLRREYDRTQYLAAVGRLPDPPPVDEDYLLSALAIPASVDVAADRMRSL
ncbi:MULTISPECIES: SDR family oxidoreductase [unclassified Streptomyces]|uniref:SDR family oxidoreductase n=1 Tax=unclassified Streptomyces TaxID=2593676 RepID=UPI002E371A0E|nr:MULTISPECIES: SDR family oxidoreductase [unclassified Streptomyces]WUC63611.1 SDR family oxidoreductase [Streptomyces sp. NBC_00539]